MSIRVFDVAGNHEICLTFLNSVLNKDFYYQTPTQPPLTKSPLNQNPLELVLYATYFGEMLI